MGLRANNIVFLQKVFTKSKFENVTPLMKSFSTMSEALGLTSSLHKPDMMCRPVIPAHRRQRQEDEKFKLILNYTARPSLALPIRPCLKNKIQLKLNKVLKYKTRGRRNEEG